ncbi:acyltransferase [Sphingomonas sp. KRR8]|uniref:acyltransferase family protein n=1 Tax=Sphingomonas sp. KRR8 TaxID=2942996 RepID=UPI002021DE5B|nr:acyltransferase [Sphingomonas sp. KRR8]URD61984.1 acyltransferase [Sphingomonas sp. KRR8]
MFKLIQALRGVAAFWIVLFHASAGGHIETLKAHLPGWVVKPLFQTSEGGVAIFFALSGFVIAHSIRDKQITSGFVGRFALRRSLRLDPPYWAAIALAVLAGAFSAHTHQWPSGGQVLAHLTYTQTLLGFDQINPVFWTLTYEVQFYLVLVVSVGLAQRYGKAWVGVPLALIAVLWGTHWLPEMRGLFVNLWHSFFIGSLAYWGVKDRRAALACVALAVLLMAAGPNEFTSVAVVTALGLMVAGQRGWLENGLSWRPLQVLGQISYSLYLTHNPVTGAAFFLCVKAKLPEWASFPLVLAIDIAFAVAFWWALERPSMALAKRVRANATMGVV